MDISTDRHNAEPVNRSTGQPVILRSILGFVWWLIGFFMLTEEDRVEAGIYINK